MANLTITVPDDVLRRARARAALEGTSVNRLLRASLERYVDDEGEVAAAWDAFLELTERSAGRSPGGQRTWRRDDLQRSTSRRR